MSEQKTPRTNLIVGNYITKCDTTNPDGSTCEDIERDLEIPIGQLEAELADARAALSAFTKKAQKYHDDCGHGQIGSVAECDAICDCLPAAKAVLAKSQP